MELSTSLFRSRGRTLFLPAHSRGAALSIGIKRLLRKKPGIWDLPELPDFGGPLISDGLVAKSQMRLASLFGAARGWYGVNGATGLLQAGLLAMAPPGSAVLMPRNVHRSLIHACVLGDLTPVLFDLPFSKDRGHFLPPNLPWIQKVIQGISRELSSKISAVVLVNPSYQGYSTNVVPLVKQFHQQGWPVIVDEAHGTHFAVGLESLPNSGIKAGADLVVHSLHKSATGLVQTAVLWWQGKLVDPLSVERSIGLLQTSSPSALLLASCESSLLELISKNGKKKLSERIYRAKEIFLKLSNKGLPLIENQDPLRLVLNTARAGITGFEADEWMISRGIVAELPEPGCLTFCMGFAPHNRLIGVLNKAWDGLISFYPDRTPIRDFLSPSFPLLSKLSIPLRDAWSGSSKVMSLKDAVGQISAEMVCPYPPGIPILIPGELLDKNHVSWLMQQKLLWPNQINSGIRVVS